MEILIITGPPYSGKGTQCNVIKELLNFEHISTGDKCREEKQNETEIGKVMCEYEEKGNLVPDSIMKDLFAKILDENKSKAGIILDGYPRTKPQVEDLLELVDSRNMKIGKVLNIDVPKSELLIRAKKRAETSNRKDDKDPQIHLKRIDVFEESTRPAIEYMKSRINVLTFDGLGTVDEITARIKTSLL